MGKVDILVIGNEPYFETREQDHDLDLNAFYEAMAGRIIAYRNANCGSGCKTRLYMRSEEHTSELQSLMRISYAVICLKKNTHNTRQQRKHRMRIEHHITRK